MIRGPFWVSATAVGGARPAVSFAGVALCVGLVSAVAAQSSVAASVSTVSKTKAQAKSSTSTKGQLSGAALSKTPARNKPSVALKSLSARVAVTGWDGIGSSDWPAAGDSVIARATGDSVDVFRDIEDPNTSLRLIKGRSVAGPVVLMAVGALGDFVRVAIPLRPNGTLGWVRRSDVTLSRSTFRVEIDLSTNTMTVFDGPKVLLRAAVAAGTGGTPTPRGLFFLKELVPQNPGGALGPFAFGLSGFSNVLTSFGGGEGVIGIHGTNSPGKLGSNVSHGCVRVDNGTISKMARLLPLGTPVEIVESAKSTKPTRASSAWLESVLSAANLPAVTPRTVTSNPASGEPVPPVVLLAEPVISQEATTTTVATTFAPTTTQPLNDDPLGAVTAR
jgi:lipoprotein-anchoring transpeptidase ErfK/SrfK